MEVYQGSAAVHTVGIVPENIPPELKAYGNWVVHRNKEPYDPQTGRRASTTDSRTWAAFAKALEALDSGRYDGMGFVFSSGDPFCGIDLDNCRNPESGDIDEWAQKIIDAFDSGYKEISPSGTGIHIIVRGKAPSRKRKGLEIYSVARYFRMTGRSL